MRYVIAILVITGFLIWDGWKNDGRYLNAFVGELKRIVRVVGA